MIANHLPYKLGSSDLNTGGEITPWGQWFERKYKSYAAKVDGYYGNDEFRAVSELQFRLGIPITGVFDQHTAEASGFIAAPRPHIPVWIYTAPGSGASWDVGPSFETGKFAFEALNFNHQPIGFPMGGYLGLMGGDSSLSYNEVIAAEGVELERLLSINPDINDPNLELWFSGYSQSADGMEDALVRLFGDGGRFAHLRSKIKGVLNFGNPSRQENSNGGVPGYTPKGYGIARKIRPQWLIDLVLSITRDGDFYACTDDDIRPPFYKIIVQAETSLPFFVHVLKVAVPVILNVVPLFGGLFGPLGTMAVAAMTGLGGSINLLGSLMGQAGNAADDAVDKQLIDLLSVGGIITHIPDLIRLVGALPGIQKHGDYWSPQPEFGGRSGIQVACDVLRFSKRSAA